MPSTVTMPTMVFILMIALVVYVVFRDDFHVRPRFKPYRKTRVVVDETEMYDVLIKAEEEQIYELN